MTLWQIDIYPREGAIDREGARVAEEIVELGLAKQLTVEMSRSFLIEGEVDRDAVQAITDSVLQDSVTQRSVIAEVGSEALLHPPAGNKTLVHVMAKPGVMDPVAQSTQAAIRDAGWPIDGVRTVRKFWLPDLPSDQLEQICRRALSNDSI